MLKLRRVETALFFLTLLFLPTQLGRHFWPPFSHVYSLPVDYLSPTVYFWDILVGLLWIFFLLSKKHINRLALLLFYVFFLTQSASLIFNPDGVGPGLVRLEQYLIAGLFGVYIASIKWEVLSVKLFWPLLLAVFLESVLAILQFVKAGTLGFWILGERTFSLSTPAIAKFDFYGQEFLRPYATFPHPNVLAGFLVITLLLLSLGRSKAFRSSMTTLSIFLGGLTALLTVSRTALMIGFVAGLVLLERRWKLVLVVLVLALSPFLFTRFSSTFNYDNLTLIRREQLSEIAWNMFLSSPIFGAGLNNFIPEVSGQVVVGPNRFLQPVHNIFLLSLAETGIMGAIGVIGLIGYPIFKLFRLRTTNPEPRTTLLICWAVVIFLGLFDHYFLTLPQGYRLLFLIWGLSLSFSNSRNLLD